MKSIVLTFIFSLLIFGASAQDKKTCAGTTKAGQKCQIKVKEDAKYCYHHNPDAKHCKGKTKLGENCKMKVGEGKTYCHHHKPSKK